MFSFVFITLLCIEHVISKNRLYHETSKRSFNVEKLFNVVTKRSAAKFIYSIHMIHKNIVSYKCN